MERSQAREKVLTANLIQWILFIKSRENMKEAFKVPPELFRPTELREEQHSSSTGEEQREESR